MTDENQDQVTVRAYGKFDVRFLKKGQHSFVLPIPDEIISLIGHIAVQWGAFEHRMDVLIDHFFMLMRKKPPGGWSKMPFIKRKKLFKDIASEYTSVMFPDSKALFREICDRASPLHIKRNVIVHGYIEIIADQDDSSPTEHKVAFIAHGVHKGRKISYRLTADFLQQVKHEISHLTGNIMAEINRMGGRLTSGGPELVVPDIDFLQDQQSGNFRTLTMQDKSKPPPQSSEE